MCFRSSETKNDLRQHHYAGVAPQPEVPFLQSRLEDASNLTGLPPGPAQEPDGTEACLNHFDWGNRTVFDFYLRLNPRILDACSMYQFKRMSKGTSRDATRLSGSINCSGDSDGMLLAK